jgi:alkanesulfonate monooxygenase SsuD/methylene tetrahydromethanopterin reductase-like flavin-dependent oxidoreductase (luciferase family)
MRIGLYLMTQYPLGARLDGAVADLAAQARAARDSGFASIWLPQHFVTEGLEMFQPMPLLGRLAAEAEGLTFGSAIMLYSMLNPTVVAEETATLDWITGGRFILGVGLGYRREEFEATGVPFAGRAARYEEAIGLLRRLWREERVSHRGVHFALDGRRASLRPKRPGGPPLWMGGEAPAAIERAARLGDAWFAAPAPGRKRLQEQLAQFRAARAAAGLPLPDTQPLTRECCIGVSRSAALAVARGPLLLKYRTYAAWGQGDSAGGRLQDDFESFMADRFIVGDEAEVADEIARYRDESGVDHLILRLQWPGLGQDVAVDAIRRVGRVAARLS